MVNLPRTMGDWERIVLLRDLTVFWFPILGLVDCGLLALRFWTGGAQITSLLN
jgi:hypothetical protein